VFDEDPRLLEGAGIEEELHPLAGRESAVRVELGDSLLAAALEDGFAAAAELFDGGASGQGRDSQRSGEKGPETVES
jgi:hypothetical protein